ncbi:hypothetical protein [Sphingomonas sp.]|uniref:hypothetical protein n=1 Tax=Sphingomonas sp. TaxID=28214 RepID=UPI003BA96181
MTLSRARVRALTGRTGATGAQGAKGDPGYKSFKTWSAAAASTGTIDETIIVLGDSGSHLDPVTGSPTPVSNSGRFARRAGGLERIDDYSSTAQAFYVATVPPATPASGTSQAGLQFDSPNRSEGGVPSSVRFALTFSHNPYAANAQYSGQPEYTNNVAGLSWNLNSSLTPIVNTKGAPSIRIEHRFKVPTINPANPGGWIDGSEFHHAMHTVGSGGIEYRPISVYAPFNNADWAYDSGVSFTAAKHTFADGYRNVHVSLIFSGTEGGDKSIFLSNQVRISHEGNNTPWQRQMNAAGNARLNLPFLDFKNHLQIGQPIYASIASPGLNQLDIQSLFALTGVAGFTNGARLVYMNTNAITGSATGFEAELSASTRFDGFSVRNTHASGRSGGRIIGNGNLFLDFFRETDFQQWGMGLRTDGTFAIGQQVQGTAIADAIRINFTTLQTTFLYPPKLPSYTVAGLPNPTTVGAGAEAFCTNEAGGAVPVFSDGTNWRRVTDRTIAA